MSTYSSSNINPLHRQRVKGREIIITEEPLWFHDRIYIKPLPKYLLSYRFWEMFLVNQSTCLGGRRDAIRKAALGYLRTYRYLIQHESDFHIAKQDHLCLVPHGVRPVEDATGLTVLRDPLAQAQAVDVEHVLPKLIFSIISNQVYSIVAIHGIGAHPDDTWCKNVGTPDAPCCVNWLTHEGMLPQAAPNARILRYGYESEWFGENAISQKTTTVADRLLLTLRRERKEFPLRPLIMIAHCFGGLVVLKALLKAQYYKDEWTGIFESTTGLVFFGTPFNGSEGMKQSEMLEAAQREYNEDQTQTEVLRVLEPGNEFLQDLVDSFCKTRLQADKARVTCFFEMKPSNVGVIVGGQGRIRFVVPFSLKGVPSVSHFVGRESEIKLLEDSVLPAPSRPRRKVYVIHGLGGIGKTQLAIEFARKHHQRYNAVFWLNGSSRDSLCQSLVDIARKLPRDELTADIAQELSNPKIDVEAVIRGVHQWLSLPSNRQWLLIFDNIDRDHTNGQDLQSYDVKDFFPDADHGSIIITSRLSNLQRYGRGFKLSIVDDEEAMTILENNADRLLQGSTEAPLILDRLQGLPLALTQAGAYLRETNITLSHYIKHYNHTWDKLMQDQDEFPLQEYSDRTILTTWKMSYNQVVSQNQDAAGLLRLWAFLDNTDLWYEMLSSASQILPTLDIERAPAVAAKLSIVDDEEAMTILENNADRLLQGSTEAPLILDRLQGLPLALTQAGAYLRETNITLSHYIKHYNHTWDKLMQDQDEFPLQEYSDRTILTTWKMSYNQVVSQNQDAAGLLRLWAFLDNTDLWYEMLSSASQILPTLDIEVSEWLLRVARDQLSFLRAMRMLSRYSLVDSRESTASHSMHAVLHKWCFLLSEGSERKDLVIAATVEQWPMLSGDFGWIFFQLARGFSDQGKLVEAEQMYQRALQGTEKALGPDHTSTLRTVNNLGALYSNQGKLVAEQMYERALQGYEKALGPDHIKSKTVKQNIASLDS
ncbi:hypothetical protein HYALB_00012671 [Hymenoscyphus albidus]|uniref:Orc1-like AAA ATPase domain-containing protein n=1 Tax=Hymenoscyphus albidus TaxID=595503 RepID=A0A9N9PYB8_9HELO|nr:hypothetical protein HYALB_00012671 [Hymenoscyphus albidus]